MRPENFLIHESSPGCLDLLLCDFGGSKCDELGLDGEHLSDGPFRDPTQTECCRQLDIFSLGSMFYTISTGLWPCRSCSGPFKSPEEFFKYDAEVSELFFHGKYPSVAGLIGGGVIMGCWLKQHQGAAGVLKALDKEMYE